MENKLTDRCAIAPDSALTLNLFVVAAPAFGARGTEGRRAELIMFEQQGCEWCEVWNEEIASALPKRPEGKCELPD